VKESRIRVFLADDHQVVREGVKHLVNHQPDMEVVGEAADGATACAEVARLLPDLVVMDMSMPQMNGARATASIRRISPGVKVIALTVHEDKVFLRELLEAGVLGYVVKRAAAEDLIRAIRIVHGGNMYLDPAVTSFVAGNRPDPGIFVEANRLSEREREILILIARGHLHKEIATMLKIGTKTVDTHKHRASAKVGLTGRAAIVHFVRVMGWLDESLPEAGRTASGSRKDEDALPPVCGDDDGDGLAV
jgi:DNA-binding NarL/FixJ family response regulator